MELFTAERKNDMKPIYRGRLFGLVILGLIANRAIMGQPEVSEVIQRRLLSEFRPDRLRKK